MPVRTGKCILARNIKLDRDYKNILNYTETQMVNLVTTNAVATRSNCSFTRPDSNEIILDVPYGTALQANYLAFQNPDYSNKWFFAFIEDTRYESNGTTRITFNIDECATWFDYWHVEPCFVIREHAESDNAGENTIPENLEHGEYVSNGFVRDNNLSSKGYILQATEDYDEQQNQQATYICGIYNAGRFWYFPDTTDGALELLTCITDYDNAGKGEAIKNVYVVPAILVDDKPAAGSKGRWGGMENTKTYLIDIDKQTTIDGYTPRNKKLLTEEYNFLVLDNNNGSSNKFAYELFSGNQCNFEVAGVPCCGCSIKCYPKNYKGQSTFQQEGIAGGKWPTCGWVSDPYTNWLTQNAVNLNIGHVAQGAKLIGGVLQVIGAGTGALPMSQAESGGENIGSGITSIFNEMATKYQHDIMPVTAGGNINIGDLNTSFDMNKFYFIKMSIKAEFARSIDDYFDRKGYATNRIKVPNQTGRTYWNYVQIAAEDDIGYSSNANISVPAKSMEVINNVYRKGVTIWHNHANIGDYSLNNTIVS